MNHRLSFLPPVVSFAVLTFGCAPGARLTFPQSPLLVTENVTWYDVAGDGRGDFALIADGDGRVRTIGYDDAGDGSFDRLYRLDEYANESVPHLIILFDSIPFEAVHQRYEDGAWRWFDPPEKVIPPFPSMSGLIFSQMLGAPPMPGMINRHFDPRAGQTRNMIVQRAFGHRNPWQKRLHYHAAYSENGRAFIWPRTWFHAELARVRDVFDASPDRITIIYLASSSGMVSRFGKDGLEEVLNAIDQLTLQLLYERRGAVKISILADHGHNMVATERIQLDETLREAGFNPTSGLDGPNDVVVEMDGMVNYIGIHTTQPQRVADALLARHEVQLAMYQDGSRIIVRNEQGSAGIERRDGAFRYAPLDHDVLDYATLLEQFAEYGMADAEGFVGDVHWFEATVHHEWPDAPRRLWDAFHGIAVSTPQLMLTLHDGYSTGLALLDLFIEMASTHGGLNQVNSATFVMSMTGRAEGPMRAMDVLRTIEPELFAPANTFGAPLHSRARP